MLIASMNRLEFKSIHRCSFVFMGKIEFRIRSPPFKFETKKESNLKGKSMKTIKIRKITGYKKWIIVEVVEGSEEHKQIIRTNKIMNYQNNQERREFEKQRDVKENEVSADQLFDEEGFEFIDEALTPEEYVLEQFKNNLLWEAVQSLPQNQREIVILKFYHNLSIREIARLKGINHSSIAKSLQSALDKLRKVLNEEDFF